MARILAYGDSLTAGYYAFGTKFRPYSIKLSELLGVPVDHVGLSGFTAKDMVANINEKVLQDCCECEGTGLNVALTKASYSCVIILAGTNDLAVRDADEIFEDLRSLHKCAQDQGCKTVALLIPEHGQEGTFASIKEIRTRVNEMLSSRLPAEFKDRCQIVDIASHMPHCNPETEEQRQFWSGDLLHCSVKGYDEIAVFINQQLKPWLLPVL